MFILEVESQPILFNTTHPVYKGNLKMDRAWADNAEQFGVKGKFNIT